MHKAALKLCWEPPTRIDFWQYLVAGHKCHVIAFFLVLILIYEVVQLKVKKRLSGGRTDHLKI